MDISNEKYIGNAKLKEQKPKKPFNLILGDKCVKNKHLDNQSVDDRVLKDKSVKPEKVSDDFVTALVKPLIESIDYKYKRITDELYNMIESLQVGGVALSDRLGERTDIGVTQKALTALFNALNARIDDIAGQWTQGFSLVVSPDYFISEDDCLVNIKAVAQAGVFDHIAFYGNDELIAEGDQVSTFIHTTHFHETTEVKCVASIMGIEYVKTKMVTKYYPFFVGAGKTLEEALSPENAREYDGSVAGGYDVNVNEGDKLYVLIPLSIQSQIVRIDMNGYEIPVDRMTDGRYVVYESLNVYTAGLYNIDVTNNTVDCELCDIRRIDELFDN